MSDIMNLLRGAFGLPGSQSSSIPEGLPAKKKNVAPKYIVDPLVAMSAQQFFTPRSDTGLRGPNNSEVKRGLSSLDMNGPWGTDDAKH